MQDTRPAPRHARSRRAAGPVDGEVVRESGVARLAGRRFGFRAPWFGAARPGDGRPFSPA